MIYLVRLVYTASDGSEDYQLLKFFGTYERAKSYAIWQKSKHNHHWRVQIATLSGVKFEDVKI